MRKSIAAMLLSLAFAALPAIAQEQKPPEPPLALKAGDAAPDFTLLHYDGTGVKPVSLSDYRGEKQVVLAFFVFAFTGG
jgi:hypothetical protein